MPSLDVSIAVRIKPVNKPTDKVIFRVGNMEIHKPAIDVVRELFGPVVLQKNGENLPAPGGPAQRLDELRVKRPNIGEKGLHGIYAGNARGYGESDGILEALDEAPEPMTWEKANEWAKSIGGRLPTRKEQALLFANVPELFKQEAYWSCEPYAGDESFAWCQSFDYGGQNFNRKDGKLRARAVRRLPIE